MTHSFIFVWVFKCYLLSAAFCGHPVGDYSLVAFPNPLKGSPASMCLLLFNGLLPLPSEIIEDKTEMVSFQDVGHQTAKAFNGRDI